MRRESMKWEKGERICVKREKIQYSLISVNTSFHGLSARGNIEKSISKKAKFTAKLIIPIVLRVRRGAEIRRRQTMVRSLAKDVMEYSKILTRDMRAV